MMWLFVVLGVLAMLITVGITYISHKSNEALSNQAVFARRQKVVSVAATVVRTKFDGLVNLGISLVNRQLLIRYATAGHWYDAVNNCRDIIGDVPEVDRIFMTDTKGTIVSDFPVAVPSVIGESRADKDWFRGLSRQWQPYVSEVFQREAEPKINIVAVAVPVKNDKEEVIGTLVLQIRLEGIASWLKIAQPGPPAFMYLVDQHGNAVGHPLREYVRGLVNCSESSVVQKVLRGQSSIESAYDPIDKKTLLSAYEPVPKYGWGVILEEPIESAFASMASQSRLNLVQYLSLLVISIFSAASLLWIVIQRRQSRRISELKDQFLFLAAHELRTPVTAIKWGCELVEADLKKGVLSEETSSAMKDVRTNAEALSALVSDLLDAARMGYGMFKVVFREDDLNPCLAEAVGRLRGVASEAGVELRLKVPGHKVMVMTDFRRVGEAVINLVSNAIKYNRRGGHVELSLSENAGRIAVSVSDNGIGLSAEDITKLFQRFSRIETAETKDIQGTGLGLFIVKKIAEMLGGEIVVRSSGRGAGSIFTLYLPAARSMKT